MQLNHPGYLAMLILMGISFQLATAGAWLAALSSQDPLDRHFVFIDDTTLEMSAEQAERIQSIRDQTTDQTDPWLESRQQADSQIRRAERQAREAVWQLLSDDQRLAILDNQRQSLRIMAGETATHFSGMAKFMAFSGQADTATVWEGLSRDEDGNVIQPAADDKLITIHKHTFYEPSLTLTTELELELWKLLIEARTFQPYAGARMCGGFSPDVCIRLTHGDQHADVLICLTCEEAQIELGETRLPVDFDSHALDRIRHWCQLALPRH